MKCKSCGASNKDWASECWVCSAALKPSVRKVVVPLKEYATESIPEPANSGKTLFACRRCSYSVEYGEAVCGTCGAELGWEPAKDGAQSAPKAEPSAGLGPDSALKLAEQLKPAFAGFLADGSISKADVLGTLMDLIVRGYIGLDADTQKNPQVVRRIYRLKKGDGLLPFEREFLKRLFSGGESLGVNEAGIALNSGELEDVISKNLKVLADNDIARSKIVLLDAKGSKVDHPYWSSIAAEKKTIGELESEYKKLKDESVGGIVKGVGAVVLLVMMVFLFSNPPGPVPSPQDYVAPRNLGSRETFAHSSGNSFKLVEALLQIGGALFGLIFGIFGIVQVMAYRQLRPFMEFQFNENIVPAMREKYAELFRFIKAHPLREQRLHNEFMPFAVAFGLDTSWNRSFGVPIEPVTEPSSIAARRV